MNKKIIFFLTIVASALLPSMAMDIYVPAISSMARDLGIGQDKIQWTLSIFMFGMSVGQIFLGPVSDIYGRRKTILTSAIVFCLTSYLCAISANIYALTFWRFWQSIASCGAFVTVIAVVRDYYSLEERGKIYNYIVGSTNFAPMLAPIIGGYLMLWFGGWRATFYALVLFGMFTFFLSVFQLPETNTVRRKINLKENIKNYKLVLSTPYFLVLAWCASVAMSVIFLFFSVTPVLFVKNLGIPEHHFGFYFGIHAIISVIANFTVPKFTSHVKPKVMIFTGCLIMLASGITLIFWGAFGTLTVTSLLVPMGCINIGISFLNGSAKSEALKPFGKIAGTASSAFGFIEFSIPSIVALFVMKFPANSALIFGIPTTILSSLSLLFLLLYYKMHKPEYKAA